MRDELCELLEREVRLAPDVAELEGGLVVAGVLVVDQLQLAADVDEVLGEQVVVARNRRLGTPAHGVFEGAHLRLEVEIAVRQAETALLDDADVAPLDLEHVEVVAEPARAVEAPARVGDRREPVAPPELLRAHHLAREELQDERVVLGERGDDRGADSGFGRGDRVVRLVLPVDRKEARVLARDADDVAAGGRRDLVVRVREAGERLDLRRAVQLGHRLQHVVQCHGCDPTRGRGPR